MQGGEIFVPKIPSLKVSDLAKTMYPNKKLKIIGLRPGEKLHEEMISESETYNTVEYKNLYIICPNSEFIRWSRKTFLRNKNSKPFFENKSYNSLDNKKYLSMSEIKKLLKLIKILVKKCYQKLAYILNFNYGKFIGQAIESCVEQVLKILRS